MKLVCPRLACQTSGNLGSVIGKRQAEHDGCSSYPKHQPGYRSTASYNDFETESVGIQESQAQTRINLRVFNEEETKQKFKKELGKTLTGIDLAASPMDETWTIFKASLIETLSKACGVKKASKGPVKKTSWWNDNVKEAIKDKKKLYKAWAGSKLEEDYIEYRSARRHCKRAVKEAKQESWKKYGEQLSELCRHSPRNFYKSVKAMRMRDETYDPTTIITDQNGNPANDKSDI